MSNLENEPENEQVLKLVRGSPMRCPHCNRAFEEPVEDFTVPGETGTHSTFVDTCFDCEKSFSVMTPDGRIFHIEK